MQQKCRAFSTLVLLSALASPFGQSGVALGRGGAVVSPKHFALTRRDVPSSFRQVGARWITDAEADRADHLPSGTFERHGRIGSYQTSFRFVGRQFATLLDNVIAFTSARGAHWDFRRLVDQGRKPLAGQAFQALKVTRLGDESAGYVYRELVGATPVNCGIAIFRQGAYTAWVVTCGFAPTYRVNASPALARIIDGRMRSGH